MRPFFSYFGSKWLLAKKYGVPKFDLVIEPFAGSAAYAVYHEPKRALLLDINPRVVGVWKYLITASEDEILRLPTDFETVDQLDICQGAKWLIGYWLNKANAEPRTSRSA